MPTNPYDRNSRSAYGQPRQASRTSYQQSSRPRRSGGRPPQQSHRGGLFSGRNQTIGKTFTHDHRHSVDPRRGQMFSPGRGRTSSMLMRNRGLIIRVLSITLIIVFILFIASSIHSCVAAQAPKEEEAPPRVATEISAQSQEALNQALDQDDLLAQIAQKADKYPDEAMLTMAIHQPASRSFIVSYPALEEHAAKDFSESATKGQAPQFYTWDARWAAIDFAEKPFILSGSGPTILSAAYMSIYGEADRGPADMMRAITSAKAEDETLGMSPSFLLNNAKDVKLQVRSYEASGQNISAVLENKGLVAIPVDAAKLDSYSPAHWILVLASTDTGAVRILDPMNEQTTAHEWDPSTIAAASSNKTMYALSATDSSN